LGDVPRRCGFEYRAVGSTLKAGVRTEDLELSQTGFPNSSILAPQS
jgi:hypothetical protein